MTRLSISQAWTETADILRRDFGAFFAVALALLALPDLAISVAVDGRIASGAVLLLTVAGLVVNVAGSLAIAALALGGETVVGPAIRTGFRRALPALLATLPLILGAILLFTGLILMSGISALELQSPTEAMIRRVTPYVLAGLLLCVLVGTRFVVLLPVAAAEALGPLGILRRAWQVTRGHFWKLLAFNALVGIAFLVVKIASATAFGLLIILVAGPPTPGSLGFLLAELVSAVVGAAFGLCVGILSARIYVQLAAPAAPILPGAMTGS